MIHIAYFLQVSVSTRYEQRLDEGNLRNYGRLVVELATAVPDGLVVFFVSYSYMDYVIARWHEDGILADLMEHKLIFIETQVRRDSECPEPDAVRHGTVCHRILCGAFLWSSAAQRRKTCPGVVDMLCGHASSFIEPERTCVPQHAAISAFMCSTHLL